MVSLDNLKFKERDALEDVISSYYSSHDYDIERYRDTRLRAHYKERYDVRKNMVDWDYSFYVKKVAPLINQKEYQAWRMNGLAFETRLASNNVPNRTFGSFVPGQSVSILLNHYFFSTNRTSSCLETNKRAYHGAWILG